ncbi:MAG: AfsR/SARP family transcriptional regulator [Pyrinomonadaceae bacterium]
MSNEAIVPSSLEIYLLGTFRVVVDGALLEKRAWPRQKPKLLIKTLALQPLHRLHQEQLMELLWPEQDSETAVRNIYRAIHIARRVLEPQFGSGNKSHFILTDSQQVLLSAPKKLWIDVDAFEQQAKQAIKCAETEAYESALALYEDDLLIEDIYQDWTARRRERLCATHRDLLSKVAQCFETQGQYQRSIERLKELLASDPPNEDAHRRLMRLYALTGSKFQALEQYRHCCEVIRKELDAEPDRETVELHKQILSRRLNLPEKREEKSGRF